MFDFLRYFSGWQTIGFLLTIAGVWGFFAAPDWLTVMLTLVGFAMATSDGLYLSEMKRELKGRSGYERAMAKPWPVSWPGYILFLVATAIALFLRAYVDGVSIQTIVIVGSVILLSSAALILLRLAFTRAHAPKKTG